MNKPPAFQFYVDNFIEGCSDMTDQEVGLYIRLLCAQWSRGAIPNDDAELLRFSRGSTTLELKKVKTKFKLAPDGLLRNERLEKERSKQVVWRLKSSVGGHNSAETRKSSKNGSVLVPRVVQPPLVEKGNQTSTFQSPVSSLHIPKEEEGAPPKLPESPVPNFPEAQTPSWKEFWEYAKGLGLPEFYAKDKFLAAEQENWTRARNWRAYATRVLNWWAQDGRPKVPVKRGVAGSQSDPREVRGSLSHLIIPGNSGI